MMLSICLRFNSRFSRWTWVSWYQNISIHDFIGARMMDIVVTTGATRCAKLQSNRRHQQTNTRLFTGRIPFLSLNQQCQSTEGKKYHIPWICSPQAQWGLPTLSLTTSSSGYLEGRVAKLSSAVWCQYPSVICGWKTTRTDVDWWCLQVHAACRLRHLH